MKLLIISHKETWRLGSGYGTVGGFPLQIETISRLFDETTLMATLRRTPSPSSVQELTGDSLETHPLPEPPGRGGFRKVLLPPWLLWQMPAFLRELRSSDAVHALVPGDVGFVGLVLALGLRKPLFVRHCGTWGHSETVADRALAWLLPRIAGGKTVVLATGGGAAPPSAKNPKVAWIFSTTLRSEEIDSLPSKEAWRPGAPLRVATVSRLSPGKNTRAAIEALTAIRRVEPSASLDVVGDGPARRALEDLARQLDLEHAVDFHGNLSHREVLRVLSRSHLFLFPTRVAEGFPKAVIEAMACSLPVVAPPVSVLASLLADGRGVLLEATDGATVGRACAQLLKDPERLAKIGCAARNAAQSYTLEEWQRFIRSTLEAAWGPLRDDLERTILSP